MAGACCGLALLAALTSGLGAQGGAAGARPHVWTPPRLADGHPDLEGTWENNVATPLERPPQLAGKPLLSEQELDALVRRARATFTPASDAMFGDALYLALVANQGPSTDAVGNYSQNWLPDRYFERRTSLITDPPDGRLPPMTDEATRRLRAAGASRGRRPERAQDLSLPNRCVAFGIPDLFAAYMSVYRITQSPDDVAIEFEKMHDARVIPTDGRPRIASVIYQYEGDSRGRWDGDTLVIETTNFHPNGNPMGGIFNRASEHLKLTERLVRVSADTIEYTFTVDDPATWTRPWTAMIPWKRSKGELQEYACHEGNYSMRGMLAAARAEEAGSH
jgi:hypothetical protein